MTSGSIVNSTISGQSQIAAISTGSLLIDQSTITGNGTAASAAAVLPVISNAGSVTVHNSIIAGNSAQTVLSRNASNVLSGG